MSADTDRSRQSAARAAGLAFLLSTPIVLAQYTIEGRVIVPGDAAATARNIAAHEGLYRVGTLAYVLYGLGCLALIAALYLALRAIRPGLALFAAVARLPYAAVWLLLAIDRFSALRLVTRPEYGNALGAGAMQQLARLFLSGLDVYYVGLPFYGIAASICGYLWLISRTIPRLLAIATLLASLWCAACAFTYLVLPSFSAVVALSWFDVPSLLVDLMLSVWLLVRGVAPAPSAGPARRRRGDQVT
ncbi:MAG: DUF4386 domain-containing protein [Acidobacteria bacterium]|nr:DUF4386 domain-containing protein [Acidobacteriota bacterium]